MSEASRWVGPLAGDLEPGSDDVLVAVVPPERWPYGLPSFHEECCRLHAHGLFCDCAASAADGYEHGECHWPSYDYARLPS